MFPPSRKTEIRALKLKSRIQDKARSLTLKPKPKNMDQSRMDFGHGCNMDRTSMDMGHDGKDVTGGEGQHNQYQTHKYIDMIKAPQRRPSETENYQLGNFTTHSFSKTWNTTYVTYLYKSIPGLAEQVKLPYSCELTRLDLKRDEYGDIVVLEMWEARELEDKVVTEADGKETKYIVQGANYKAHEQPAFYRKNKWNTRYKAANNETWELISLSSATAHVPSNLLKLSTDSPKDSGDQSNDGVPLTDVLQFQEIEERWIKLWTRDHLEMNPAEPARTRLVKEGLTGATPLYMVDAGGPHVSWNQIRTFGNWEHFSTIQTAIDPQTPQRSQLKPPEEMNTSATRSITSRTGESDTEHDVITASKRRKTTRLRFR